MVKKLFLVLLIFLCLINCVFGTTWYVRPKPGEYGNEDGTTYADAWDGFEDVNWVDISAGDTLYICGTHVRTWDGSAYQDGFFIPGTTGTEANHITIAGYSSDPAIVYCTYKDGRANGMNPDNWTGPESGVYYNETAIWNKAYVDFGLYENISGSSFDKYTVLDSNQEVTDYNGTGVYFIEAFGTNQHRIWLKPFNSGTFKDEIRFSGIGSYFFKVGNNKNYIDYIDIDFIVGDLQDVNAYHHNTFTNCSWLSYGALYIYAPTDANYITFDDCEFAYGGNGVYVVWSQGVNHHIYIQNCYFHDIGKHWNVGGDGHGIGVMDNEYFWVTGNTFERCGSAINFHVGETKTQKHCYVTGNWIDDMRTAYANVAHGSGVGFVGSNDCNKGNTEDMIIASNIIINCEGGGIGVTRKDYVEIYNNVVYNCDGPHYSIVGARIDGASAKLYNNISISPNSNHVYFNQNFSGIAYDFECDNNVYYPDAEESGAFYYLVHSRGFNATATFTEWKTLHSGESDIVDGNSIVDNPDFLSVGSNFKLQSSSPAVDAGIDVGLTEDYIGTALPQDGDFDIGAYEYISGTRYLVANLLGDLKDE